MKPFNWSAVRDLVIVAAVLAILLSPAILAGCEGFADRIPPITLEACYLDPEYGKVCGVITRGPDGKYSVMVKADVTLPADVRARFDKWADLEVKRLEGGAGEH